MNLGTIWSKKQNLARAVVRNPVSIPKNNKIVRNVNKVSTRSFWGAAVWYFFHTVSGRINENYYRANYEYIWNFFKRICSTLPCPHCQKHAIQYVSKININKVNSKEKLKNIIFHFHNSVNSKTGKKIEPKSILEKYDRANIKKIFDLFEERFFHSYIGRRQFDDWIKNEVRQEYYKFYNNVRFHFD